MYDSYLCSPLFDDLVAWLLENPLQLGPICTDRPTRRLGIRNFPQLQGIAGWGPPIPTYPVMVNPYISPPQKWVFMGKLSPRIPREHKIQWLHVRERGTPNCPLTNGGFKKGICPFRFRNSINLLKTCKVGPKRPFSWSENGAPISRVISPRLPMYFRLFIGGCNSMFFTIIGSCRPTL